MDEWKARAVKKKDWRRGGIEPDPPKKGESKRQLPKIYKVEYKWKIPWCRDDSWRGWSCYREFQLALNNIEKMKREATRYKQEQTLYKAFRIIHKKTKEVLFEEIL